MTQAMKFVFFTVNAHTETLRQLITNMEQNLTDMQGVQKQLLAVASGAGMEAFQQVAANYGNKLSDYSVAIRKLEIAIGDVAGSHGQMSATDKANANRFLAIKV